MDAHEVTRIIYSRVQSLEPENVSKIMGLLFLQNKGDQEMVRLAFGPAAFLQAFVSRAKKELGLPLTAFSHSTAMPSSPRKSQMSSLFSSLNSSQLSAAAVPHTNGYLNGMFLGSYDHQSKALLQDQLRGGALQSSEGYSFLNLSRPSLQDQPSVLDKFPASFDKFRLYTEQGLRDEHLHDQFSFLNELPHPQNPVNVFPSDHSFPELGTPVNGSKFHTDLPNLRPNDKHMTDLPLRLESGAASAWKPCMYYARGYCKHGNNCRFLHSHGRPEPFPPLFVSNGHQYSLSNDGFVPAASIERLELELQDLLRGQQSPVSIASLPQLYYERYGKILQAEGYLTESQRHGKAGYSLTKLLARLSDTVTLIDRPHGQHAVVLAEDARRFLSFRRERDDLSEVAPGSHQIYLTFPAESTFTEDDVATHFRVYGPVQDVRIPYQQKRMFGFVSFVYPETVAAILAKGNPHYICGARVLVKPYKEKGKHSERKLFDTGENPKYTAIQTADSREYCFSPSPRFCDDHDIFQRQFEGDQILGLGMRKLAELQMLDMQRQLAETSVSGVKTAQIQKGHRLNGLTSLEDLSKSAEDMQQLQRSSVFGFLLDVLDSDPGEDLETQAEKANNDHHSDGHCLPDSPFNSPHSKNIVKTSCLSEEMMSLTLSEKVVQSTSSPALTSSGSEEKLTCPICMDIVIDPMQMDCSHTFCVQCILKVIRVSKEECPLCQQHIGSQIAKLLESRGLQIIDPLLGKRGMGSQSIW